MEPDRSRDWAAKGTKLLGVKAVITESFERIHRSNLVGMGVVPLVFTDGVKLNDLNLTGDESIDLIGISNISPACIVKCIISRDGKVLKEANLRCRIDTEVEIMYFNSGGVLPFTLNKLCEE